MIFRAIVAWLSFVVLAVLNGGLRQRVPISLLGDRLAHVLSTIILSAVIVVVTWTALPWLWPASARDAWILGALWLVLTIAFEFLAGHYLFKTSWEELFVSYNLAKGRICLLVLLGTLLRLPVRVQVPLAGS